jgi:hypothetical protein
MIAEIEGALQKRAEAWMSNHLSYDKFKKEREKEDRLRQRGRSFCVCQHGIDTALPCVQCSHFQELAGVRRDGKTVTRKRMNDGWFPKTFRETTPAKYDEGR